MRRDRRVRTGREAGIGKFIAARVELCIFETASAPAEDISNTVRFELIEDENGGGISGILQIRNSEFSQSRVG